MCFFIQQNQPLRKVEDRFKAKVSKPELFTCSDNIAGFEHKTMSIILDTQPEIIQTDYHWGLVPHWSDDTSFAKNTLNARIETLEQKPSFKDVVTNRCLIIASAFYEWHWNDIAGKSKTKYTIYSTEGELFAMAGLYTTATIDDSFYHSFTLVTTEARDIMSYVHNTKNRMPIVLSQSAENVWLDNTIPVKDFANEYQAKLIAF